MLKPIMTWADIDKNWDEIMEILKSNLKLFDDIALNRVGNWMPAQRPLIEDIVCARACRDDLVIEYMRAAGITVELGADRTPRTIDLGAKHRIPFGQGGEGRKA